MLGGAFTIESRPGHGTTLYIEVPLSGRDASENVSAAGEESSMAESTAYGSSGNGPSPQSQAGDAAHQTAELARAKALSDALVEIMAEAARSSRAEDILARVLDLSAAAIGCDTVHLDVREGKDWVPHYDHQNSEAGRRFSDAPALAWVERTREILVVNDTAGDVPTEALRLAEYGVKSYACIPLLARDELRGVLSFINYAAPEPFAPSEIAFFTRLADLVSLALDSVQQQARVWPTTLKNCKSCSMCFPWASPSPTARSVRTSAPILPWPGSWQSAQVTMPR